jgi:hypothetical protein
LLSLSHGLARTGKVIVADATREMYPSFYLPVSFWEPSTSLSELRILESPPIWTGEMEEAEWWAIL